MSDGQISSYRSADGKHIYAGIPVNPDVEMLYIGGEKDKLADPLLIERKVKNSKSKKVSFLMMKNTDHLNLMFGKKSIDMIGKTISSFLRTGLSTETMSIIDANKNLDINTNDPRYVETHHKEPRIQKHIDGTIDKKTSCSSKHYLVHLQKVLSSLLKPKVL